MLNCYGEPPTQPIKTCGYFRTVKRKEDQWELVFKHTRNDLMVTIAYNLNYNAAEALKNELNGLLKECDGKMAASICPGT